jgi:hypothetical protein
MTTWTTVSAVENADLAGRPCGVLIFLVGAVRVTNI